MNNELLKIISFEYKQLIPQDELTTLLLVSLHIKVKNQYIEEPFSQKDFDDTIEEVTELLQLDKDIQKETIAKKIRKYFFVPVKGKNPYELTVFTKDFCEMIIGQVNPIIGKLELYHTFQRTLPITDDDTIDIEKFEFWYEHNFIPARKTIKLHIEELYRFVDEKIINLRQLLKPNIIEPRKLLDDYIAVFEGLGEQTTEIMSTLSHKQEIIDKIKNVEDLFLSENDIYDRYLQKRTEIERFFENIDNRIISINERIYIASSRLNALYETLRHKNLYKVQIEKFLMYLLSNSKYEKGEIILPYNIQSKELPYFRQKFLSLSIIDFTNISQTEVPSFEEEVDVREQIIKENLRTLEQQECVSKWLDYIHCNLKQGTTVDFYEILTSIRKEEEDIEVPINVCSNLIQQSADNVISIEITNEVILNYEDITLWNMKIKPLNS